MTSREQNLSAEGLDEPGALAAQEATDVFLDHELARTKARLRRLGLEPAEWRNASYINGTTMWVTAFELREIAAQPREISERYAGRAEAGGCLHTCVSRAVSCGIRKSRAHRLCFRCCDPADIDDAISVASQAHEAATVILDQDVLTRW